VGPLPHGGGTVAGEVTLLRKYRRLGILALLLIVVASTVVLYMRGVKSGNSKTDVSTNPLKPVYLTSYSGKEEFPALSPDGNYVAFTWNGPGEDNYDIYVQGVAAGSPLSD
jgi:hypothetical protein